MNNINTHTNHNGYFNYHDSTQNEPSSPLVSSTEGIKNPDLPELGEQAKRTFELAVQLTSLYIVFYNIFPTFSMSKLNAQECLETIKSCILDWGAASRLFIHMKQRQIEYEEHAAKVAAQRKQYAAERMLQFTAAAEERKERRKALALERAQERADHLQARKRISYRDVPIFDLRTQQWKYISESLSIMRAAWEAFDNKVAEVDALHDTTTENKISEHIQEIENRTFQVYIETASLHREAKITKIENQIKLDKAQQEKCEADYISPETSTPLIRDQIFKQTGIFLAIVRRDLEIDTQEMIQEIAKDQRIATALATMLEQEISTQKADVEEDANRRFERDKKFAEERDADERSYRLQGYTPAHSCRSESIKFID